jgi:hypothetical protein
MKAFGKTFELFGVGLKSMSGRRGRAKPKAYHFQAKYVPAEGTERHCYIHPRNVATHFELNSFDKSYRRPVCAGCAA